MVKFSSDMAEGELVLTPIGGLANRMRAMVSGILLARSTGRRLKVVWNPNDELKASFSDIFDYSGDDFDLMENRGVGYALRYEIPRLRNLYVSGVWQRLHFDQRLYDGVNMSRYRDDEDSLVSLVSEASSPCYIMSGIEFFKRDDTLLRKIFRPSKRVSELVEAKCASFAGHRAVGVHIRRTDNAKSIDASPTELFIDRMKKDMDEDAGLMFFLATDSQAEKAKLYHEFGDRVVSASQVADRKSVEGMQEAYADMLTLSRCSRIYGSYYSSFSEIAAQLGGVKLEILKK